MPNAPAAWCAHSGSEYAHQYSQRRHRKHPAFPTRWFTTCSALFPGTTALLTPSSARRVGVVANLTPASGRQNHTASPSASSALVSRAAHVHRIPPDVRDDREPPLLARQDGENKPHISEKRKKIFFARGLDRNSRSPPVGQITLHDRGEIACAAAASFRATTMPPYSQAGLPASAMARNVMLAGARSRRPRATGSASSAGNSSSAPSLSSRPFMRMLRSVRCRAARP